MQEQINFSYRDFDSFARLRSSAVLVKCDDRLDAYFRRTCSVALGKEWDYVLRKASIEFLTSVELGTSMVQYATPKRIGKTSFEIEYLFTKESDPAIVASIVYVSVATEAMQKITTPANIRNFIEKLS
ncbi:MAG: hypothetical protein M0019_00760 [Actinomycetota bacterium]|nr:hypothetical protein [Actinomycetota bacterium]